MIRYVLRCADDHNFESWFQSAAAFDKLHAAGMVTCAICGSGEVRKSLMAPTVSTAQAEAAPLSTPSDPQEQAMAKLRREVEENSDYVGKDFAREVRLMHAGDSPTRAVHGEAEPSEARKLLDEGIPVAPLPFVPARITN